MEKEKDSKLKQAMKGLDSFLTTHYSFRSSPLIIPFVTTK